MTNKKYAKYDLEFTSYNRSKYISMLIGFFACACLQWIPTVYIIYTDIVTISLSFMKAVESNLIYVLISILPSGLMVLGIVPIFRILFGNVKIYDSYLLVNYGASFINRKIYYENIISFDYLNSGEKIPKAQPANGNYAKVIKVIFNEEKYNFSSSVFITTKDSKGFFELLKEKTKCKTG